MNRNEWEIDFVAKVLWVYTVVLVDMVLPIKYTKNSLTGTLLVAENRFKILYKELRKIFFSVHGALT